MLLFFVNTCSADFQVPVLLLKSRLCDSSRQIWQNVTC